MNGSVSTNQISITSIDISKTSRSRRALRVIDIESAGTQVSYTIATYLESLGFSNPTTAFDAIKASLSNKDRFNNLLQTIAKDLGANDMLNVNSDGLTFTNEVVEVLKTLLPSFAPLFSPKSSSGSSSQSSFFPFIPFIWSIVVIGVIFLIIVGLAIAAWYYYGESFKKHMYESSKLERY